MAVIMSALVHYYLLQYVPPMTIGEYSIGVHCDPRYVVANIIMDMYRANFQLLQSSHQAPERFLFDRKVSDHL